ncbi:MAG TPA: DUF3291 domain-containing protein [Bryobacteraceae bacterium]|nr:DUF3291 domain-containing protein [Bryobacteraceae bacterium]
MSFHLAQVNISRLIAPLDDPRIADFVAQLAPINALAERAPGFIWRLQSDSGNATDIVWSDDPFVIVNMSVWESIDALRNYAYASQHKDLIRDKARWFEKMDKATYCMWWVPAGHQPTVAEARQRLEYFQEHGPTPYAFWFSRRFPMPEQLPAHA